MVRGTIFSFVVAVAFILAYLISWQPVFAILSIFMALFGAVLVLLGMKEKVDVGIDDEEELV